MLGSAHPPVNSVPGWGVTMETQGLFRRRLRGGRDASASLGEGVSAGRRSRHCIQALAHVLLTGHGVVCSWRCPGIRGVRARGGRSRLWPTSCLPALAGTGGAGPCC